MDYRRSRRARLLAATVGAVGLGLAAVLGGAPATAVPAAAVAAGCPAAFPQDDLTAGQPIEGRTVTSGTDPVGFTGTYLETLEDGIAPGVDMIMVKLSSPTIDFERVGIWAGMSGSPVYDAATGQLVGAVSYSLAWGPSPIAGVTPAAHLQALLTNPPAAAARSGAPTLSPKVQRRLVASGTLTKAEARSGIRPLDIPLAVAGTSERRFDQLGFLLGDRSAYRATGAAATSGDPIPVDEPGDNLAASLSVGTVSATGLGTATLVCGDEVVGFGHPMDFVGRSTYGLHGASALFVQEDPIGGSYKLGNVGATVGVVDQDRLTGIRGKVGPGPAAYDISSTATSPDSGGEITGDTSVHVPDWFSALAAYHLLSVNDRALDRIGAGSATAQWTVTGVSRGQEFSYTDRDVYVDGYDISWAAISDIEEQLFSLEWNEREKVTLTDVTATLDFQDDATEWSLGRAYVKVKGSWKRITGKVVPTIKRGGTRYVRLELYSRDAPTKYVTVPVTIAKKAPAGRPAWVTISGGNTSYDMAEFEEWYEESEGGSLPASVASQIKAFKTRQKNDELRTTVWAPRVGSRSTDKTGEIINGEVYFRVAVR